MTRETAAPEDRCATRRTILVTGGSRGIGAAIVRRLAQDGHQIAIAYRQDHAAAEGVAASAAEIGAEVALFQSDMADPEQALALPDRVAARFGRLDALVGNAGVTDDGPLLTLDRSRAVAVLRTNLFGTIRVAGAALPFLRRAPAPAIVLVSSLGGIVGKEGQVPYAASKGGLIGLALWLGEVWGAEGIRVNAVAPGFIGTDMTAALEAAMTEPIVRASALKRFGRAEEVAEVVRFLLSPGYIQSTTIRVDGGFGR